MMMNVEQSVECELSGETEVLGENCPNVTLSTTYLTRPDLGSIPERRGGKPAINRLSYGTNSSLSSNANATCQKVAGSILDEVIEFFK
jgi:hypothetical protein